MDAGSSPLRRMPEVKSEGILVAAMSQNTGPGSYVHFPRLRDPSPLSREHNFQRPQISL